MGRTVYSIYTFIPFIIKTVYTVHISYTMHAWLVGSLQESIACNCFGARNKCQHHSRLCDCSKCLCHSYFPFNVNILEARTRDSNLRHGINIDHIVFCAHYMKVLRQRSGYEYFIVETISESMRMNDFAGIRLCCQPYHRILYFLIRQITL